jgi:hypothetical protein
MRAALVLLLLTIPAVAQQPAKQSCKSFRFRISLSAGQDFEKSIGEGLTLAIKSEDPIEGIANGWDIALFKQDRDYIYPVNLPIRFNPTQFISPAYGQTLQDQTRNRSMKFLWKHDEYERITTLEQDVLWPYQAKGPDKAVADYTRAVNGASIGELRLEVRRFKVEKEHLVAIDYDAEVVVPEAFHALTPTRAAMCPLVKI